jgi:peptidoglycan/LPS O-acetylase OafA/YrhL
MTVNADSPSEETPRRRIDVLDGIRGIAIVLVVLSHGWTIWPTTDLSKSPVSRTLFASGNFAVSIFFVIGAYLAVTSMLRASEGPRVLRFGVFWVRRWIRISAHVYVLVIAVLALTATDTGMNTYKLADTRTSALHIVTYTWTDYVSTNALLARPDLGHLWYVCTDIWVILLLSLLVYLFARRRATLFAILAAITVAVMLYRHHVYVVEGEFQASVRITCRMDSMLWGAMAAVALPWLRTLAPRAPTYGAISVVSLVPIMFLARPTSAYYGYAGVLLDLALFVFVISIALAPPAAGVQKVLAGRSLRLLGRYSLPLYLWHYPIFWYLARNTISWSWEARVVVGISLSMLIALVTQRVIEKPLQSWLSSSEWRRAADDGLLRTLTRKAREAVSSALTQLRGSHSAESEPSVTGPAMMTGSLGTTDEPARETGLGD